MMNKATENNHSGTRVRNPESGQAIVLMALVAVILLGALGLAIDGGGLYFLWRDAQNATDAAVMAATYARCTNGDAASVISAGLQAATQNGFNNNGTSNTVSVQNPPLTGSGAGDMNYIQVDIKANKPAYFIQIIYKNPLQVTTHAVGYCSPPFDPAKVPGLWAGSKTCQNTVDWSGSNAYIEGGLFSNNEIKVTGSGETVIGPADAHGTIDGSNVTWDPANPPQPGVPTMEDPMHLDFALYKPTGAVYENVTLKHALLVPTPLDDDFKAHNSSTNGYLWSPKQGRTLEGLYYVNGDVDIGNTVNFGPQGVTIVAEGTISWAGGTNTHYYNEVMNPTPSGIKYPGIMLATKYVSPNCGDWGIKIPGPSSVIEGVFYAPKSGIDVSGSNIEIHGSIVGDTINYSGSQGKLIYEPSLLPPRPPSVQMAE